MLLCKFGFLFWQRKQLLTVLVVSCLPLIIQNLSLTWLSVSYRPDCVTCWWHFLHHQFWESCIDWKNTKVLVFKLPVAHLQYSSRSFYSFVFQKGTDWLNFFDWKYISWLFFNLKILLTTLTLRHLHSINLCIKDILSRQRSLLFLFLFSVDPSSYMEHLVKAIVVFQQFWFSCVFRTCWICNFHNRQIFVYNFSSVMWNKLSFTVIYFSLSEPSRTFPPQ